MEYGKRKKLKKLLNTDVSPGQIKVKDLNNDGAIDANDDKQGVGHTRPRWTGGWSNTSAIRILSFPLLYSVTLGIHESHQRAVTLDGRYMQRKVNYWVAGTNENAKILFTRFQRRRSRYFQQCNELSRWIVTLKYVIFQWAIILPTTIKEVGYQ